ncbi:hypothetical protein PhCBS80983_g00336 [Powellomyces hirtus]|uniref:WD repeat-containing protein 54 beta-propeller domain-containing protein n=1 Tax=Powellomyces hirtus TaxID=109895 RepID=A0A507EGI7_9FUNG|nr:hypothetical protein PhCBS80983_g00336 [Powellomyces hirtus]
MARLDDYEHQSDEDDYNDDAEWVDEDSDGDGDFEEYEDEDDEDFDFEQAALDAEEMEELERGSDAFQFFFGMMDETRTNPNKRAHALTEECIGEKNERRPSRDKGEGISEHATKSRRRSVYGLLMERELGPFRSNSTVPMAKQIIPNRTKKVMDKYGARAYSGQFSEDGNFFYLCTQDFQVHLYDTSDPANIQPKVSIQGEIGRWTITDCALSPDNRNIIYSSITPQVYITSADLGEDEERRQTALDFDQDDEREFGIWSIRFSGDGREIVAGASNSCLYVYDIETRNVLHQIPGHADDVNAVCFADASSSHILYSASDDSFVKIWDRRSLGRNSHPAGVFVGHTEGVTYLDSKNDGRFALSNGKDQQMKMWDLRKCMEYNQFVGDETLEPGYFREEWDYRIGRYPGPRNFRHPRDNSVQTFVGHSVLKTLIRCHFSPAHSTGQQFVYGGSADGKVRVWNMEGEVIRELNTGEALSDTSFANTQLSDDTIFEFLRPRRLMVSNVTRDCSWHPHLPYMISTSWCGVGGAFGAAIVHEYMHED